LYLLQGNPTHTKTVTMGASNYYGNSATTNNMQIMTSKILVTIDTTHVSRRTN